MVQIAHILIEGYTQLSLDYLIPETVSAQVGCRVEITLRQRKVTGIILTLKPYDPEENSTGYEIKPINRLISEKPALSPKLMEMAQWLADYYLSPLEIMMRCFLPESSKEDKVAHQTHKFLYLEKKPTEDDLAQLNKKAPKQAAILHALILAGGSGKLHRLGVDSPLAPAKVLAEKGFIRIKDEVENRDPEVNQNFVPSSPLDLNTEQAEVLDTLKAIYNNDSSENKKPVLLHGVTGSGKTEVYLQLVAHILELGYSAIVLVPEISLTPQTIQRFKSRFAQQGNIIAILHSHLSTGERFDEWQRIHRGEARIVIGARSAIFAPIQNLGLIIVDEEHDPSYKQESSPRYHGRNAAVLRGHLENALVVLGSATPSVETSLNVKKRKYQYLALTKRVIDQPLPRINVIDMRMEAQKNNKSEFTIISDKLRASIDERLRNAEQTILFLNKRGFSRSIQCPECGLVVECPHCSLAMTYHRSEERLICHLCGQQSLIPQKCPNPSCQSDHILFNGYGIQKAEGVVRLLFPKARVARIDADISQKKHAVRSILNQFKSHKIDILIGTQMIAKGLDFPGVTLVGILNADMGLHIPDFRAGERTFQVLTQVAGRAGRGSLPGEVIIQTFTPHAAAIQFARHHDAIGFNKAELEMREMTHLPPYSAMLLITAKSPHEQRANFALTTLYKRIKSLCPPQLSITEVLPAPITRIQGQYRFQLMLQHPNALFLSSFVRKIVDEFQLPDDVKLILDVDPLNFL